MSDFQYPLGFIGAGNMAEAIARGAIESGALRPEQMAAADPSPERRALFEGLGLSTFDDAAALVPRCAQVMLAVKPQVSASLAEAMQEVDRDRQVVISIMAGVTIEQLETAMGGPARVIRVMPNTPLMVGQGMSAVAVGEHAEDGKDENLCVRVLQSCGKVVKVVEEDLDAVTAVSGSGPAYVFLFIEAMTRAAQELGLSDLSETLVQQTFRGAVQMLFESAPDPEELRRQVTSPGGTTQAAIEHLQKHGFEELIRDAVVAARDRSIELGRG
ncbi:MAG: pyrroline-5-carboxylate reductase [Planctomycetota bacterium]